MSHSIEIYSSFCYPYDGTQCFPEHSHESAWQVFFSIGGDIYHIYESKSILVKEGYFLIAPAGCFHGMQKGMGTCLDIRFGVYDDLLAEYLKLLAGRIWSMEDVKALVMDIVALTNNEKALSLRMIALYLEAIFCEKISAVLEQENRSHIHSTHLPRAEFGDCTIRAMPYIEEFVAFSRVPFSVNELGKEIGYSEKYLYRQFSRDTGVNLTTYFRELRIRRAKHFLEFSDMSITAIADIFGYKKSRYFVKYFKKHTGVSPEEYRNACRESLRKLIGEYQNS